MLCVNIVRTCTCTHCHNLHTCTCTHCHNLRTCTCTHCHNLRTCTCTHCHNLRTCTCTHCHNLRTCTCTQTTGSVTCTHICHMRKHTYAHAHTHTHTHTLTVCGAIIPDSRYGIPPRVSPNFSSKPMMSSMICSWICQRKGRRGMGFLFLLLQELIEPASNSNRVNSAIKGFC